MIRILLSTRLGELRWKQADLARMIGIRPSTINDLYHEMAERVSLEHLDLICEASETKNLVLVLFLFAKIIVPYYYFNVIPFKLLGIFSIDIFSTNYAEGRFYQLNSDFPSKVFN